MVYDVNGENATAYTVIGNQASSLYDVDGNRLSGIGDYAITELHNFEGQFVQGMAYCKGTLFQFNDNSCATINIDSWRFLSDGFFTVSGAGHGDSAMFSTEYYAVGDKYPLCYVSTNTSPQTIKVYRMTDTSATLIRTLSLTIEASGYYADPALDTANNVMYTIGYSKNDYLTDVDGTNFVRIAKYDLSDLTLNQDGSYTPRLISTFDCDYWLYVMQGITYYDGLAWVASGGTSTSQYVYAIDPESGNIEGTVNVGNTIETEGCAWVTDDGAPWLLIAQQHMRYQKCVFS